MGREMYDYKASLEALAARVRQMRDSEWSPTPEAKRLREMSADLQAMAESLGGCEWMNLEGVLDADDPVETGLDGWPLEQSGSNQGKFAQLRSQLLELAEFAAKQAEELPNPRQKGYTDYFADGYLRIRYECGLSLPVLYNQGPDVKEFGELCVSARIPLSPERARGLLAEALKRFEPQEESEGFGRFLVLLR